LYVFSSKRYLIDFFNIFIDIILRLPPNLAPMKLYDNEFTNGEITVNYDPNKCIHAEICAKGLSEVFRTTVIPWIHMDGADSKTIIEQVKKCPSGALSFCYNKELAAVK